MHTTTNPSGAPQRRTGHPGADVPTTEPPGAGARSWARPAVASFAVAWGANMFASLLQTYRHELSAVQVTGLFGAYALGLIPAVLVMARLADRLGRRAVLITALLLSVLGSALLAAAGADFALLLVGRAVIGVSAGAAFAPATASIGELSQASPGAGGAARGGVRASTALTAGFALGPLVSGVVVQFLPSARPAAYGLQVLLALLALRVVWTTPEVRTAASGPTSGSTVRRALGTRAFLAGLLPTAPWVFGAATTALAALPVLVPLGRFGPLGSGVVAAVTLGTGILVQPAAQRLARRSPALPLRAGMVAVVLGMSTAALTVAAASKPLLLLSAVVLGSAYGLLLGGGLHVVRSIAGPRDSATVTGVFYALTYLGFAAPVAVPALGASWTVPLVLGAAAVAALLCLGVTFLAWPPRRGRRSAGRGER